MILSIYIDRIFFTAYADADNWQKSERNGIIMFRLQFDDREAIQARFSFIYSITCYLCTLVGCNKSLKSISMILCKKQEKQIENIGELWEMILENLEYHNDYKLWKYVYSFLYNINGYFRYVKEYVGNVTLVNNPSNYKIILRGNCMKYINQSRTEILIIGYLKEIWKRLDMRKYGYVLPKKIAPIIQIYHVME